jgi:hypothetical protein
LVDAKLVKDTVNAEILKDLHIINNIKDGLKVLAKGELKSAITIEAVAFSETAKVAIEKVGGKAVSVAKEVAEETQANYPATTGIACSSTLEGTTLNVNVDLYAKEADTYKLVVLLLEDNIVGYQNGGGNSYEHNDVARLAITPIQGEEVVVANDFEICKRSYTTEIKSSWKAENLRLMIYVEKPFGEREHIKGVADARYYNESTYVDNCRSIPVGVNAELELN